MNYGEFKAERDRTMTKLVLIAAGTNRPRRVLMNPETISRLGGSIWGEEDGGVVGNASSFPWAIPRPDPSFAG